MGCTLWFPETEGCLVVSKCESTFLFRIKIRVDSVGFLQARDGWHLITICIRIVLNFLSQGSTGILSQGHNMAYMYIYISHIFTHITKIPHGIRHQAALWYPWSSGAAPHVWAPQTCFRISFFSISCSWGLGDSTKGMAFVDDFPRKASSEFRDFPTTVFPYRGFFGELRAEDELWLGERIQMRKINKHYIHYIRIS